MEKRMIGFEVKDNRAYVAGTCEKAYLEGNFEITEDKIREVFGSKEEDGGFGTALHLLSYNGAEQLFVECYDLEEDILGTYAREILELPVENIEIVISEDMITKTGNMLYAFIGEAYMVAGKDGIVEAIFRARNLDVSEEYLEYLGELATQVLK